MYGSVPFRQSSWNQIKVIQFVWIFMLATLKKASVCLFAGFEWPCSIDLMEGIHLMECKIWNQIQIPIWMIHLRTSLNGTENQIFAHRIWI